VGGDGGLPANQNRRGSRMFVLHDAPPHMRCQWYCLQDLKDFVGNRRPSGQTRPYVPGWDCHGFQSNNKVVKESRTLSRWRSAKKSEAFAANTSISSRALSAWACSVTEHPYLTKDPKYETKSCARSQFSIGGGYQAQKPVFGVQVPQLLAKQR